MKKINLLKWGFLCLFGMLTSFAWAQDTTTALWDWANDVPSSIQNATAFEGNTGTIESNVEGISMYVDATNGKLNSYDRVNPSSGSSPSYDCQFNPGTILRVPVVSVDDEISVVGDTGYSYFTIGGGEEMTNSGSYKATETDVAKGYVEIVSTESNCYLQSVSVAYVTEVNVDTDISSDLSSPSYISVSPENGESMETLSTITVSCTDGIKPNSSCEDKIQIDGIETDVDPDYNWLESYSVDLPVNLTSSGTHTIIIPVGYFTINGSESSDKIVLTYELSGYPNYNIELVSPTDVSDGLTKLAVDEFTLTITADQGLNIMLDVYSDNEDPDEQHVVSLQWFIEDTENPGQYTWTAPYNISLTEGLTYTFYATPYSSQNGGTQIGDAINVLEVVGAKDVDKVLLTSIDPDPERTETLTTNEITLTFSDNVKITSAYVYSYADNSRYQVNLEYDENTSSDTWTFTIPDGTLETLTSLADEGVGFSMVVYAKDEAENDVYDMSGELPFIEVEYDAVSYTSEGDGGNGGNGTTLSLTVSPADGETVTGSVSEITISSEDAFDLNWILISQDEEDGGEAVNITNANGDVVAYFDYDSNYVQAKDNTYVTWTLSQAITETGEYTFTLPYGLAYLYDDDTVVSEEMTITFTIGTTTGINSISLQADSDDMFYNLNGQKVTTPRNGVFILNGKKVLIK